METLKSQIEKLINGTIEDEYELLSKHDEFSKGVKSINVVTIDEKYIDVLFEMNTDHPCYVGARILTLLPMEQNTYEVDDIQKA
jgi:hypothetical protein